MIRVREAIVVEGRYDKNKLSALVDGIIVETEGFGIFRDREKLAYLKRLARERGLIVLTDSDGAGFVIRGKLSSQIPKEQLKHAYIPDIPGKERRKAAPSKEGKLGVEGMELSTLRLALERAGATIEENSAPAEPGKLTKADLYTLGLSGEEESALRRKRLQKLLGLPERLSANGLLQALNALYPGKEFREKWETEWEGQVNGADETSPGKCEISEPGKMV